MHKHTNKLVGETSPYLLQHAHNPVDWYPWGSEALKKAADENKPILVSIGYAACHWCHVMERESFENEATAAFMNQHFVNIKIDREERPDLDHIYMDAVQAMTGSGGWPLNVFLTPETKPFYGGTYFPPVRAYNRASWFETLQAVNDAFTTKRTEIETQAASLTEHLIKSNSFGVQATKDSDQLNPGVPREASENLLKSADREWGGFGKAPKFPQTFCIQFLLRYHYVMNIKKPGILNKDDDRDGAPLQQALLSIDKMIEGGIYDQVGGGFARYSTDTEWLVPHFEKMLYDNALIVSVLCEAYQLTKEKKYKEVIDETMAFVQRELLHPAWGFYSALDADSEGVEGKFYVWDKREVEQLLGRDAEIFCRFFDITEKGNWEGKNIPRISTPFLSFAKEHGIEENELKKALDSGKQKLLAKRNERIRPLLDDKFILGWNALMNIACCKAYAATGSDGYRQLAIKNMQFLLEKFVSADPNVFFHTWKSDRAQFPAFLDDYAFLVQALIQLHDVTGDTNWLTRAKAITGQVIRNFSEPGTSFFFYTPEGQTDIIVRKKELYDSAVPSGNSVMAGNLYTLSIYFDDNSWKARAENIVKSLSQVIARYPASFGWWNCIYLEMLAGTAEIAIMASGESGQIHADLLKEFLPHRVIMVSNIENEEFALLAQKPVHSSPAIYVCENFNCQAPVGSVEAVLSLINRA